MTVREIMEFLSKCDADARVIVCDWQDEEAIRVFSANGGFIGETRWASKTDEEDEEDE